MSEETLGAREEASLFAVIFQNANVGIAQIDSTTGRFIRVNEAYAALVGKTRAEMEGATFQEITHPDDLKAELERMARLKRGEIDSFSMEKRYRHADGSTVWGELRVTPLWPKGETPTSHVAVVVDITERKEAERLLADYTHFLHDSQMVAQVGSYSYDIARDRWESTPTLDKIFGIEGVAFNKNAEGWLSLIPAEDRERMETYLVGHVITEGNPFDTEYRIVRPNDGAVRWLYGRGRLTNGNGESYRRLIGSIQDVTEKKEAALRESRMMEELRASEERWRSFAETSPDHIIGLDTDLNVVFVNRPSPGLTIDDLIGHALFDFVIEEEREKVRQGLEAALSSGTPQSYGMTFTNPDGRVLRYESTVAPRRINDTIVGLTIAARDVTEREEAERRLVDAHDMTREAAAEKERYLSIIVHDIKSPIVGVLGMLKVIKTDPVRFLEDRRDIIGTMIGSLDRVSQLVESTLRERQFTGGSIVLKRRLTTMRKLVEQALDAMALLAQEKGITLRNELPADFIRFVDPNLITQVFINAISNAIKFSRAGGEIVIRRVDDGGVEVVDHGVGIPLAQIDSLLDTGHATSTKGTRQEEGYGMGLPYCRRAMSLHEGVIDFAETPGGGATVRLTFPDTRPTALIADDDELVRVVLGTLLQEAGHTVVESVSGSDAIHHIQEKKPDLLILDLNMEPGNGYDVLQYLQETQKGNGLPTLVITSDSRPETREKVLDMGGEDLLMKPIDQERLLREVELFLSY